MRTSVFRSVTKAEMIRLVNKSTLLTDILVRFGLRSSGTGNYFTLRKLLNEYGIDYSRLIKNRRSLHELQLANLHKKKPLVDILVCHSNCCRYHLKRRLIKEGLLSNKCDICGQIPVWNNTPLVMILDHINGIPDDNRLVNLRLLCPNCNSQTDTFSGRNNRRVVSDSGFK